MKDLLAYLKTIDNGQDDLAVRRIINIPKRGIGAASINKVALYAQEQEISFYDALCVAEQVPGLGKAAAKIRPFVLFIQSMKAKAKLLSVADLLQEVIETTGYVRELEAEGTDEAEARIENIDELISKAVDYAEGEEAPTLNGFLENVALVADIDSFDENSDYVVLMTLHSAKGLEFPNVYLAGLEDGLFPSYMSITSDNSQAEIEEERRLAYVGITRAKKNLTITSARVRMVRGRHSMEKYPVLSGKFRRNFFPERFMSQRQRKNPSNSPHFRRRVRHSGRCQAMGEADMEKKWERDMDRPSVPPKPQNRYIQRWKTSVILVPRVEHCPIRWEIVSATSNLAMEKSWQLFPGAGTMK